MKGDKVVNAIKHFGNFRLFSYRWKHYLGLKDVVVV